MSPPPIPLSLYRFLSRLLLPLCIALFALPVKAQLAETSIILVQEATRQSLGGTAQVTLPDHLDGGDFLPAGSRVRYQFEVNLADAVAPDIAIYIPKMSLAGTLRLNGHDLGNCGIGDVESLRCFHQPSLVRPSSSLWQPGPNRIEVEIFANDRQMNGLSRVYVGPAAELYRDHYLPRRLLQFDLVSGLTWVSLCLGAMSLAVFFVLRKERVYLWFALASTINALSNLNVLSSMPLGGIEFFSWFVFSTRYVSLTLVWLTLCSALKIDTPRVTLAFWALVILAPVAIWLGGNQPGITAAAYVPLGLLALFQTLHIFKITWIERRWLPVTISGICLLIWYSSWLDWFRLSGQGSFEGVYVMVYTLTTVMLLMGGMLVTALASALQTSRQLAGELDAKVAARTADLEAANRQLVAVSRTDSLTGLANRRRFDELLVREWARWQRTQTRLALLMIDIDKFKDYNDHYGHPAGDECLRQVAAILSENTRTSADLLARIGGEEFAVIDTTGSGSGHALGERLRRAVAEANIPHSLAPSGRLTISVGFAECGDVPCEDPEQLMALADQALYRAKRSGRNRVVSASDPD
jgi:diguanylate cyclase (GGDEF)-like protein